MERLEKWVIDLDEYDIDYHPRTSFQAQALAEFLVEIPETLKNIPIVMQIDPSEPDES